MPYVYIYRKYLIKFEVEFIKYAFEMIFKNNFWFYTQSEIFKIPPIGIKENNRLK